MWFSGDSDGFLLECIVTKQGQPTHLGTSMWLVPFEFHCNVAEPPKGPCQEVVAILFGPSRHQNGEPRKFLFLMYYPLSGICYSSRKQTNTGMYG